MQCCRQHGPPAVPHFLHLLPLPLRLLQSCGTAAARHAAAPALDGAVAGTAGAAASGEPG